MDDLRPASAQFAAAQPCQPLYHYYAQRLSQQRLLPIDPTWDGTNWFLVGDAPAEIGWLIYPAKIRVQGCSEFAIASGLVNHSLSNR